MPQDTPTGHRRPEDLEKFLRENEIERSEFDTTGLRWETLKSIRAHHTETARNAELRSAGEFFLKVLQTVPEVHSLSIRVKNPDHLLEKIIRKKLADQELEFTVESYTRLITDLVAIRALHIFKEEWLDVHGFITRRYNPSEVTAYVRAGDRDTKQFEDQGCTVRPHAYGYRSIHYLLKIDATGTGNPQPVELQVRTIFEEAWSEIDHRLRYPRRSKEPILNAFLITFNLLAGLGDEMGAHARALSAALHQHAEALADARARGTEAERRFQAQEQEFRGALSRLQISEKEKTDLQRQLDALQKLSQDVRGISLGAGTLLEGVVAGSGYRLLGPQACRRCGRVFIPIMATPDENPLECPDCRLGPYLRHHSSRETTP